jgi:hypothetical protein
MDPTKLPVVTQQDVSQALKDQIHATGLALGVTGGITGANFLFNVPGSPALQKAIKIGVTGIDAKPTPAGRGSIKVPAITFLAAALPQPVGYVPAELYNLHPEFYKQQLGIGVGQKPPLFSATPARVKVYEAKEAAADIGKRALQVQHFNYAPTFLDRQTIPPGPINVTPRELQYLRDLPPGLSAAQDLIPQLEGRLQDLRPDPIKPPPLTVAEIAGIHGITEQQVLDAIQKAGGQGMAWYAPENYHSVNDRALDNENNDQGGRLMLAADRVDP